LLANAAAALASVILIFIGNEVGYYVLPVAAFIGFVDAVRDWRRRRFGKRIAKSS